LAKIVFGFGFHELSLRLSLAVYQGVSKQNADKVGFNENEKAWRRSKP
jgi:hypothetical protein